MIRYVIRHKPSGGFLPEVGPRMGYTGTEPIIMDKGHWCPRLFGRKQDAETALTWWLKGITTRTYYGGGGCLSGSRGLSLRRSGRPGCPSQMST